MRDGPRIIGADGPSRQKGAALIMGEPSLRIPAAPSGAPAAVDRWVDTVRRLTDPARVRWCTGSEVEAAELTAAMLKSGELERLNEERFPRSVLYRSKNCGMQTPR